MAALAGMLKQRGYASPGSDEKIYPPMSTLLERLGIPVLEGYRPENLVPRPDLVVIGNKVSRANAEVQAVLAAGAAVPVAAARRWRSSSSPAAARWWSRGRTARPPRPRCSPGCWSARGRDPSLMVGGESLDFGGNFKLGAGADLRRRGRRVRQRLLRQGAEVPPLPAAAPLLLTAVEFDHADIYRDLERREGGVSPARRAAAEPARRWWSPRDFPHARRGRRRRGARARAPSAHRRGASGRLGDLRDCDGRTRASRVRHGDREEGDAAHCAARAASTPSTRSAST